MRFLLQLSGGSGIVWINKKELLSLSEGIRAALDGQPFDPRDNREGVLSMLKNDIYTLTNAGQEQNNVLEQEKEHLAAYLSDISHQLKTPISSILLMTELMTDAPEEKKQEFLLGIKKEVRHMEWLVTALLKMAKLDSATTNFHTQEILVSHLLREALKSLDIVLDIRNQTVRLERDLSLFCDPKWTAEALINLLKNASEASGENSEILVECGQNPLYDWIAVTDAGEGLKDKQIAGLFRRFEGSQGKRLWNRAAPRALYHARAKRGYRGGAGRERRGRHIFDEIL